MSKLLNASVTAETVTSYDRVCAGSFDNPLGGAPSIQFFMERIRTTESGEVLSKTPIATKVELFTGGVTYPMFHPATGEAIPGASFTDEQVYAMLYSVMRACVARA